MNRARSTLLLATLAGATLLAGCGGDKGGAGITQPPAAVPGVLTLSLTTPHADDRAMMLSISGPGPITEITSSGTSYVLHSRASGTGFRVAVFGSLTSGALLRFSVPDVNKASSYQAAVLEVSDAANALRSTTAEHKLSVTQ